nr:hypothetical protein [uncultured Pseudomonas sp.]
MHAASLSHAAPLHSRFLAWINERFPFANALLFFILYLTTAALVQAARGGPLQLGPVDGLACLATWSFFLLLRVLDEHKDYQLDCHNHPQRVLQSGLITLDHLKVAGLLAVTAQLALSLWLDRGIGQATYAWLALLAWTLLMAKEFFVGAWLNRHLTWYAVSHMLVMPLLVYWLANLAQPGVRLGDELLAMMLLAFVSGFCFEITRKTKGPEEERSSIESYSRIFGTAGSALVVMLLVSAMLANQLWLIRLLAGELPTWSLSVLGGFYLLALWQIGRFLRAPNAKARGHNEAVVALTMLAGYAVLIAVAAQTHGLQLNGF